MAHANQDSLTIISVVFDETRFLQRNLALTRTLNPRDSFRWIVVDNAPAPAFRAAPGASVRVVDGVPAPRAGDAGSLHHALALEKGLEQVETRFVLLLDHDFFVIRAGWVESVLEHVAQRDLAFLGSVWHPRWFYQDPSFPSVHFLLIDSERVALGDLELRPGIDGDTWWRWINDDRLPLPALLRDTLKARRIRDVGWRLGPTFRDTTRFETLTPHYVRPGHGRARWEARLAPILPAAWRTFPPVDDGATTERSFLRPSLPEAYHLGWEEFFWRDAPFGVHLRRVGRTVVGLDPSRDAELLDAWLDGLHDGR